MKERPILFNGPMVKVLKAGQKTQTRRVATKWARRSGVERRVAKWERRSGVDMGCEGVRNAELVELGFNKPDQAESLQYRADEEMKGPWRPSIFMPRWASRILLEITGVRVERVQDIALNDAKAEGVDMYSAQFPVEFKGLWDSLNAKRGYGWDVNPWVWVVEFKRVEEKPRA